MFRALHASLLYEDITSHGSGLVLLALVENHLR